MAPEPLMAPKAHCVQLACAAPAHEPAAHAAQLTAGAAAPLADQEPSAVRE